MAQLHAVITLIDLWNLLARYILWPLLWRWTVEADCVLSRHESGQKIIPGRTRIFRNEEWVVFRLPMWSLGCFIDL